MGDGDAPLECRPGGREGGAGVALYNDPVGPGFGQHLVDAPDGARNERVQRLIPLHQVEIEVGRRY